MLDIVFFNQEYRKNSLHRGEIYIFYGKVEGQRRHQLVNPLLEPEGHRQLTGRIMPIYPLTAGISQLMLTQAVRQGLDACRGGKPGLRAEPALLLYGPDGRETAEHRRAYFREEEQAL